MRPARAHLRRAVLLIAGALACAHRSGEKPPPDAPPAPRAQPMPTPVEPGHPPLADAPEALFVPGAIEQLQKRLADRGYLDLSAARPGRLDSATTAAIRKFQSDQGMARTGVPDRETARRLGLDPDTLFRKNPERPDSRHRAPRRAGTMTAHSPAAVADSREFVERIGTSAAIQLWSF